MSRVTFSSQPLDIHELTQEYKNIEAGAFVSFEGRVRNLNNGKEVLHIEYEAYEPMAIKEIEVIIQEAMSKYSVIDIAVRHRVGILSLGDTAVWVAVLSKHRKEAFEACQYVMDNVKHRAPIWKHETYADHSSEWVLCHHKEKEVSHDAHVH